MARPPKGRPKAADIFFTSGEIDDAIDDSLDLNLFDLGLPDELLTPRQLQAKRMADILLGRSRGASPRRRSTRR